MADPVPQLTVRPRRSLVTTALLSIVLIMIPIFGALYWFGIEHNAWMPVFVVHLVVVALCLGMLFRQLSIYTAVDSTHLSGRGIFSPMVRVPLDAIASVHLVSTYLGQGAEPARQILVLDAAGRRLFRMRGNYWRAADLDAVAAALPVAPTVVREPMSLPEFFRAYPGSAYWFENRPVLAGTLIGLMFVAVIAVALVVIWAIGTPLALFSR